MKKVIVTTTINPLTKAISKFMSFKDWYLVVVGDKKTPADYKVKNGVYVSPEMQEKYDRDLSDAIGWNCIQRRNFGLLWAKDLGAEIVAVVDDDNIPYDNWGESLLIGRKTKVNFYTTDLPAFDPVGATNESKLWHRGFPLPLLSKRDYSKKVVKYITPDIQVDLWDGDPDIDAICRMEHAPEVRFDPKYFPFASNKLSPFDTQNTFLSCKALKDYFLFPHVGRQDDIWASYYVEAKGYKVVYNKASVYQERNPHNYLKDMKNEYLGYEHNLDIVTRLPDDPDRIIGYLPGQSADAFRLYKKHFKR